MTTLENIQTLNGQLAETKNSLVLAKDINEVRVLTNTLNSIENGINKLNEVKAEKERADIRQRVEHLTFFASCKEQLKAFFLESSDESKKVLINEVKKLVKAKYFSGTAANERFYTVEIEKSGKIVAYVMDNNGPVIGSDSLGLIKTKDISQYLGLLIKNNGFTNAFIGELFKINEVEETPYIEVSSIKELFAAVKPDLVKIKDSFKEIQVTLGYVTHITIDQMGKKTHKQKPVLGTAVIESANGVVSRFKAINRLQEKEVVKAKNAFIAGAKAGLKEVSKKK